jgi:hypothetical protein
VGSQDHVEHDLRVLRDAAAAAGRVSGGDQRRGQAVKEQPPGLNAWDGLSVRLADRVDAPPLGGLRAR